MNATFQSAQKLQGAASAVADHGRNQLLSSGGHACERPAREWIPRQAASETFQG